MKRYRHLQINKHLGTNLTCGKCGEYDNIYYTVIDNQKSREKISIKLKCQKCNEGTEEIVNREGYSITVEETALNKLVMYWKEYLIPKE